MMMTAALIREARDEAWGRALAAYYRSSRVDPPEAYYEEPCPDCPPDDELDDEREYDEGGTVYAIS